MSNCTNIRQLVKIFKHNIEENVKRLDYKKSIPTNSFKMNYYLLNTLSNINLEKSDKMDNFKSFLNENVSNQISVHLGGRNLFNLFNCNISHLIKTTLKCTHFTIRVVNTLII